MKLVRLIALTKYVRLGGEVSCSDSGQQDFEICRAEAAEESCSTQERERFRVVRAPILCRASHPEVAIPSLLAALHKAKQLIELALQWPVGRAIGS